MVLLLVLSTFIFQSGQRPVDGYLATPSTPPRALLLYFHRYTEKGESVGTWDGMTARGYAVAGFTNFPASNIVPMANGALASLRQNGMQSTPVIAMGASMGSLYAAEWFATNPQVRALILIVPGSEDICNLFKKSAGRPVFLIQADQDDTTFGSGAKIRQCLPNGKQYMVKGAGHDFSPDTIIGVISDWLDSLPLTSNQ